jgi:hypothetical protein
MCYDFVKSGGKDQGDSFIPQQPSLTRRLKTCSVHSQHRISDLRHTDWKPKNPYSLMFSQNNIGIADHQPGFQKSWFLRARALAVACVLLMLAVCANAAPGLTVSLDRDTMTAGESVTLSLSFEGIDAKSPPNLTLPQALNAHYAGQSSQYSFVNGQSTSTVVFSYYLTPIQAGDYVIPALKFTTGSQTYTSRPLSLKVLPAGAPDATNTNSGPQLAFLKLLTPKDEIYMGEVLPVDIQLYYLNAQDQQMPQLQTDGFVLSKTPQAIQTTTQVGNQPYHLIVFKTTVTPTKTGNLALGPAQCPLTLVIPQVRQRRRDPFDDPFGFFSQRAELRQVNLTSESKTIRVLPLPTTNVPPEFNGAVGSYSMTATVGPTNLSVGDPITVKIKITGRGSLDSLNLASFDNWQSFKTYPPSTKTEPSDALGVEGSKSFEFAAIPQSAEIKALPQIVFSYFDPATKNYRSLRQGPFPLQVRASANTTPPAMVVNSNTLNSERPEAPQDIINIKTKPGSLVLIQTPLAAKPWFLAIQSIPLLLLGFVWIRRKQAEKLRANPRLRRQLEVERLIARSLPKLKTKAEANDAGAFFALTFRLLQARIGERLDLPAASITEAIISERLSPLGLQEDTLKLLRDLFQHCNQARYAPPQLSEGLFAQYPKVATALEALKNLEAAQ